MNREAYVDEIKLQLTGFVLDSELDDITINKIIDSAFRQTQRYINTTSLITIPYSNCIDLKEYNIDTVTNVYRTIGYGYSSNEHYGENDPAYMQYYQITMGNSINNLATYASNIGAYNTMLQIRNQLSTDLAYKQDASQNKLYVNVSGNKPTNITIEFIPNYEDIVDVKSPYWTDILIKISVAMAKIIVGRIRTRFTQSNALWTQDGETLLTEGKEELTKIQDYLRANNDTLLPID